MKPQNACISTTAAALALAAMVTLVPTLSKAEEPTPAVCAELGGKLRMKGLCDLATKPAPLEIAYTGKSQSPDSGPLFKITNTSGRPVKIVHFLAFAYDKAGKQLPFSLGGNDKNWFMTSGPFELALAPGESKEHPLFGSTKGLPAGMDSFQGEINEWTTPDGAAGTMQFRREFSLDQMAARPSGGWK